MQLQRSAKNLDRGDIHTDSAGLCACAMKTIENGDKTSYSVRKFSETEIKISFMRLCGKILFRDEHFMSL